MPALETPVCQKEKVKFDAPPVDDPKESMCFHCVRKVDLMKNYPKYLQEVKKAKGKMFVSSSSTYSTKINKTYISHSGILDTICAFRICSDM